MKNKGSKKIGSILTLSLLVLSSFMALTHVQGDGGTRASYPYPATVRLKLQFEDTNPAAGFTVYLRNYMEDEYNTKTFWTDPNGEVEFEITAFDWGPCRLWANDSTMGNWWTKDLFAEPNGDYVINGIVYPSMEWNNTLHGIVKDSENGLPLDGVNVTVKGYDEKGRPVESSMTTAMDGAYHFMLPDSDTPYILEGEASEFDIYSAEVYLTPDIDDLALDLWMGGIYEPGLTLGVKGINLTTGQELAVQSANLYGTNSEADHTFLYGYTYSANSTTGYYEMPVGRGEYEVGLSSVLDPVLNASFGMYDYVIVNDTDVTHDLQFRIPSEWRKVSVHLEDSSGPINYAYAEYQITVSDVIINGRTHTDTSGNAELFIPAGRDISFRLWSYSHDEIYVDVEAGPSSSEVNIAETLVISSSSGPPSGQISLVAKDEVTGLPLPLVRVSGSAYDHEGGYWIDMYGTTGPDGYLNTTVDAGFYPLVRLESNLGTGTLENVTIYETTLNEITATIKRRSFPPDPVPLEFNLVTDVGEPVPNHPVSISSTGDSYTEQKPMSDQEGKVRIWVVPGEYMIWMDDSYNCIRGRRTSWSMMQAHVTVTSGMTLPDIVLYPTKPLGSIEGFVKDSVTGEIIPRQQISASSYHKLETGPTRQVPYIMDYFEMFGENENDRFYYFWQGSVGSVEDGFYRVWGGDHVLIYADREGYYYYNYELDLSTRADKDHDILLEPIPELTTHVNGTLVDQDGGPLEGVVALLDVPHDNFILKEMMVNNTGEFSLECYPGQLRAVFGNETLWDYTDIEVPPEGIEDLMLVLAPSTFINGTVTNWNGDPVPDINVTLVDPGATPETVLQWDITDANGTFSFPVGKGTYRIVIEDSENYYGFHGDKIATLGWVPTDVEIELLNRTSGNLFGRVTGEGGPLAEGIPGATVKLHHPVIETEANVTTDMNGDYLFENVPYSTNWTIEIDPPMLYTGMVDVRSGYLLKVIQNVTISYWKTEINVALTYIEVGNVKLVNVTAWGPKGQNVSLNDVIWVQFSHPMDQASVEAAIESDPSIIVTKMTWNQDGTRIIIQHDDFQAEMNYTIKVKGSVLSLAGMPMWNMSGFQWTFRTGTELLDWYIDSVEIYVSQDKTVDIEVTGGHGITIFFVIADIGSFELDEGPSGTYGGTINGTLLEWSTTYQYHFSDTEDGPDKWPSLSGAFTTPDEPIPSDDDVVDDDIVDDDIVDDDITGDDDDTGIGGAVIAGLVIFGIILLIILVLAVIFFFVIRRKPEKWDEE